MNYSGDLLLQDVQTWSVWLRIRGVNPDTCRAPVESEIRRIKVLRPHRHWEVFPKRLVNHTFHGYVYYERNLVLYTYELPGRVKTLSLLQNILKVTVYNNGFYTFVMLKLRYLLLLYSKGTVYCKQIYIRGTLFEFC